MQSMGTWHAAYLARLKCDGSLVSTRDCFHSTGLQVSNGVPVTVARCERYLDVLASTHAGICILRRPRDSEPTGRSHQSTWTQVHLHMQERGLFGSSDIHLLFLHATPSVLTPYPAHMQGCVLFLVPVTLNRPEEASKAPGSGCTCADYVFSTRLLIMSQKYACEIGSCTRCHADSRAETTATVLICSACGKKEMAFLVQAFACSLAMTVYACNIAQSLQ